MNRKHILSALAIVFAASATAFCEDAAAFRSCTLLDKPMEIGNYDVELDLGPGARAGALHEEEGRRAEQPQAENRALHERAAGRRSGRAARDAEPVGAHDLHLRRFDRGGPPQRAAGELGPRAAGVRAPGMDHREFREVGARDEDLRGGGAPRARPRASREGRLGAGPVRAQRPARAKRRRTATRGGSGSGSTASGRRARTRSS